MFDARYSLAKVSESAHGGDFGISNQSIGTASSERIQELERRNCPWKDAYIGTQGGLNGKNRPDVWTQEDTFLRTQLGTKIIYSAEKIYPSGKTILRKMVGRYSSPLAKDKLRNFPELNEAKLLDGVTSVNESLDLRKTDIKSLPKLNRVGNNLILDTNSKLEELPSLIRVDGKITVIAKNKEEMNDYLKKLGIINEFQRPQIYIGKNIEFVMRSYN